VSQSALQYTLDLNQRWAGGRASYRPLGEVIRPSEYDVAEIPDDTTARDFVTAHHYSKTFPSARFRTGLYRHGNLVGVAVFSHPASDRVLTNVFFDVPVLNTVELGRFVLLDSVPANGESYFLARAFNLIKKHNIVGVVSFSDPQPRRTARGEIVHLGHYGTIYQAFSGRFLGRGTPRTLHLLPDGRVFSDRAAQKIRAGERGWRYAAAQLEEFGATPAPEDPEARLIWLRNTLKALTQTIRHKGNFRYAWGLEKRVRQQLPASLPFPKVLDPIASFDLAA
jgi:hypothetical protein